MSRRFGNEHKEFFEIRVKRNFSQVSLSKGAGTLFGEVKLSNKQWFVCEVRPTYTRAYNKERNNKMNNINIVSKKMMSEMEIEKLYAAVREQTERVPFINKPKSYKAFVLKIILISGLGYGEVMSYLDSLNAYDESDKGWKKINWNTPLEEKFDILGWEKVVKRLIVLATSSSYSLAA